MTDSFYSQQYENAGPIARPVVQRSQYLADALRALQNTGENPIRSPGQLVANLLAQALTQYGQHRAQGQLQNATAKDAANDPLTLAFQNMTGGAPAAAPQAGLADALSGGATPPAPSPMADAIAPPIAPPQAAPVAPPGPGGPQTMGPSPTGLYTSQGPMPAQPPQATGPGLPTPTDPVGPGRVGDEAQWQQHLMAAQSGAPPPMQPPMPQQAPQMPAPPAAQPPTADALPPAGAPPAVPAASNGGPAGGMPTSRGASSITPEQRQYVLSLLNNPQTHERGVQMAQQLIAHAMAPPGYHATPDNDRGYVIYSPDDPRDGAPFTVPIPGWAPQIMQGQAINGVPTSYPQGHGDQVTAGQIPQQAMTHAGQGSEMQGITPGSAVDVSPTGDRRLVEPTHQGYQRTPTGETPLPGGSADITAPQNSIPQLMVVQQHITPLIDQARALTQNISSVREGVRQGNGIGDLAIANGFQHLLDSGIVRQEDMNTQAQAAGLQGDVTRWIQYVNGGGRLDPTHRAAFGRMAELLFQPRMHSLQTQVEGYRPLTERLGAGSYDLIVPPSIRREFGWEADPNHATPPASHARIEDVTAQLRQRLQGVTDQAQAGMQITGRPRVVGH